MKNIIKKIKKENLAWIFNMVFNVLALIAIFTAIVFWFVKSIKSTESLIAVGFAFLFSLTANFFRKTKLFPLILGFFLFSCEDVFNDRWEDHEERVEYFLMERTLEDTSRNATFYFEANGFVEFEYLDSLGNIQNIQTTWEIVGNKKRRLDMSEIGSYQVSLPGYQKASYPSFYDGKNFVHSNYYKFMPFEE